MSTNKSDKVSVIVRTIGRKSLVSALDSILLQSQPVYEVVIVNAGCGELGLTNQILENQCIKIHTPSFPLGRSAAANFGLQHASGVYCLFLDDDDWIHPGHIQRLIDTLNCNPNAIMAYAGVECIQASSLVQTHIFDSVFSYHRLLAENYIPIHAALFKRTAFKNGCRFDESFDMHEDWDFWIQLAHLGNFAHCSGVSATYVLSEEGSGVWQEQDHIQKSKLRIYEKWWKSWTASGTFGYLQTLHQEITEHHKCISRLHLLAAEQAQEQQAVLFESMQYAESLKSHLEESKLEFSKYAQQAESAMLESNKYVESLKSHLEIKELELNNTLNQLNQLNQLNVNSTSNLHQDNESN